MMGCHVFIQARTSSSRFPGKVLEIIDGVPLIVFMARRAMKAQLVDRLIVVTSDEPSDDYLESVLLEHSIPVFRGSLHDVLARFGSAATSTGAREVVRLTGDCPLIDPGIIDAVIQLRRDNAVEYASNIDPPTFPDGLDCEVFTKSLLERALKKAASDLEREHVTVWMRNHCDSFQRRNLQGLFDASSVRLTVDYPEDLDVVRRLIAHLPKDGQFDYYDMLRVLSAHRELAESTHMRNEALLHSR